MQKSLNSLHNSIVKSNKVAPPVKPAKPKPTTQLTKGEGVLKKSVQTPKPAGNPQPSLKSNPSTSSTSKNPVDLKASFKPPTQYRQPTSRPKASLSKEELKRLDDRFGELSSSVLSVATSQVPVGTRSLESLLNREVSNLLGDAVNNPEYSQGFVQATRKLLENLVSVHEGGKLNPKLLKDRTGENKSFIRASSATTVCYRDRYFKELVMNVLQTMTSERIEEEVTVQAAHSKESKERIQLIRDMVRAEAGLEPEDFKKLEQRLEELKKSLTRNKLEVERATSEVDRIISQHTGKYETCDWQIPGPAREILRKCIKKGDKKELGSDLNKSEKSACGNKHGCCTQTSPSTSIDTDGKEQYKKSLNIMGDEERFEKGNSDDTKTIRPHLKHLVHEELLRIKMKEEEILNQYRQFDHNNGLEETPKSSLESVDFKSAVSNISADDEDDENSQDETHVSQEFLKTETETKRISDEDILRSGLQSFCISVLESIEELEDEANDEENTDSSANTESKTSSSSINSSSIDLESSLKDIKEEQLGDKCMIERVTSKWLNKEESDVNDVLTDMKDAFEAFKNMPEDVLSSFKTSEDYKKETGDGNEAIKFNSDADFYLWDFTIAEVSKILVNISIKINHLPHYLHEVASNESELQKEQALNILSVLGKMGASNPMENYDIVNLDEATTSLPIKKVAKTFTTLSNTLSRSPKEIRSEFISVLNPPKSLVETLYALSSTAYFKDCFTSVKDNTNRKTEITKDIEVVKPYKINEQSSSGEILTCGPVKKSSVVGESGGCRKKVFTFTRDVKKPDDLDKNLTSFEHYMGLSACVMTVQNVSDMFLFLSTVLNDVPQRLKTEKILDLNPPLSFLTALDILYNEDEEDSFTELEKKKSFTSLTIQNVSDFLLTLSKIFDDVPEILKSSVVAELSPPRTLLRAITLLTSLSHFSIAECQSQEMTESISCETQENFFDAVDSLSAVS